MTNETTTATTQQPIATRRENLRYRPCTHLTFRSAVEGDKDVKGRQVPEGFLVLVSNLKCHVEDGVVDPTGAECIPMMHLAINEGVASLKGDNNCLFLFEKNRVYRAAIDSSTLPHYKTPKEEKAESDEKAAPQRPEYSAEMTAKELVAIHNAIKGVKPINKWGGTKGALVARIDAALSQN